MAIMEIKTDGDPVLKKIAKRVRKTDDNLKQLAQDMMDTMLEARGLGLAANQVGVPRRIIAVMFHEGPRIYINPQIVGWSEICETKDEGCLSFPNIYGQVARDVKVEIIAQDIDLKKHRFTMEGLGARVFQHEIDHLNGITFNTRAVPDTLREIKYEDDELEDGEEYDDDDEYDDEPEERIVAKNMTDQPD